MAIPKIRFLPGFKLIAISVGLIFLAFIVNVLLATSADTPNRKAVGICIPANLNPSEADCLLMEVVRTPEEQAMGLGGRKKLADGTGMLFIFPNEQIRCFWMKDMNFPIDIVWLDKDKKVVHAESGVSPLSYPKNYCPESPAAYTIEVNAGVAKDWAVGQTVPF